MSKSKRKSLSKTTRTEVFKRDSFTCQYCGLKAPDVILHLDHIHPVAEGGDNDILNLITSCAGCNLGKGKRLLSDDTVVEKRRKQLEDLQERREQIEMMLEWHRGMTKARNAEAEAACAYLNELLSSFGLTLSTTYARNVAKLVRRFGLQEVLHSCDIAFASYYEPSEALQKLGGIAENRKRRKEDPDADGVAYVFGIARRRFGSFQSWQLKAQLRVLRELGVDWDWIKKSVGKANGFSEWRATADAYVRALSKAAVQNDTTGEAMS